MQSLKVLLVDDHPIIRLGLKKILDKAPVFEVVGEAETGADALRMLMKLKPDIIVLDFQLPDMSGAQVARQVSSQFPFVHILALSAHAGLDQVKEMFDSGAMAYLTKDDLPQYIFEALHKVAAGEKWISPRAARKLGLSHEPSPYLEDDLLPDEKAVLRWMVAGHSDEQISAILELDLIKTRKLVAAVEVKLGARSRVEAIARAMQEGII